MKLETVKFDNVNFDIYYEATVERDPYGTGDSPSSVELDIKSIEVGVDTQNLMPFLSDYTTESIEQLIVNIELTTN